MSFMFNNDGTTKNLQSSGRSLEPFSDNPRKTISRKSTDVTESSLKSNGAATNGSRKRSSITFNVKDDIQIIPPAEKLDSVKKSKSNFAKSIQQFEQEKKKGIMGLFQKFSKKEFRFRFFVFFLPSLLSSWYAAAILFPPGARDQVSLLLWDNGQLIIDEDNGSVSMCPRPSICAEGIAQLIMIALARLTAFTSYVFMATTFMSKMHFSVRFFSNTYLMKHVPFESLHNIHTYSARMYAGLILIHVITHYVRYILRSDVDQLGTKVHVSGLVGAVGMVVLIVGMSSLVKKRKNLTISKFEVRFALHWVGMMVLGVSMLIHTPRSRVLMLIFLGAWALDYLYGFIFGTYNLQVVELLPLPNQSGLQMLWRNPEGFRPTSGEFVKVQMPWLSKGANEWHPFSIYLRESTSLGFDSVHGLAVDFSSFDIEQKSALAKKPSLRHFIENVLDIEFEDETMDSLKGAVVEEAREDIYNQYDTTQVFICPVGDWSKNLMQEVQDQKQQRACWVRGPYTSPYHVAQDFSHLVMTATGIGITPSLGVMGQYPGFSRTKVLIWSVRDKNMLKFFIPLITDAHVAAIYYTGKDKLTDKEVRRIQRQGNIFLRQSRPENGFSGAAESVIVEFENHINLSAAETIKEVKTRRKRAWCILYCGGSVRIRDELKSFSQENGMGFEDELFDW